MPRFRPTRRQFLRALGLGALFSAALGSYAVAVEPLWRLKVTRHAFTPSGWTPGLQLRVALIADVHACNPWMGVDRIGEIVARTNALAPDLLLLIGDHSADISSRFVKSNVHSNDWAPVLVGLRAPLGRQPRASRGLGVLRCSIARVRFGVPPEIATPELGQGAVCGLIRVPAVPDRGFCLCRKGRPG